MSNINIKSDIGGSNSNVIIRIPSKNEHSKILLNSDLNGTVDTTTSKSNVWNFKLEQDNILVDFSILQDNSTYNFINLAAVNIGYGYYISYYNMHKSNANFISYSSTKLSHTMPCFRPIFEFNQK